MRKKIVAGNWKMNKDIEEGVSLISEILELSKSVELSAKEEIVIIPPFIHLTEAKKKLGSSEVKIGAQNVHHKAEGAYTGEVSSRMLASIDMDYCLVGHSERRTYQKETDEQMLGKTRQLLEAGIQPIFCLGESLEERESDRYFEVVKSQLTVIFTLSEEEFSNVVIAYEPVWAIGTGKTASSDQAQEIHAYLRRLISEKYGEAVANDTTILYGGSCKPENAADLFSKEDVDGGLIGGASLDAQSFIGIIKAL